jgi:cation:H+ antiporter
MILRSMIMGTADRTLRRSQRAEAVQHEQLECHNPTQRELARPDHDSRSATLNLSDEIASRDVARQRRGGSPRPAARVATVAALVGASPPRRRDRTAQGIESAFAGAVVLVSTIAGLILAVYGAKLLVDGGTAVAKHFGIPSLVIGATVVAFGTSMPEFTVNIHSAMGGNTELALGNILGSNMFNIAFILGAAALLAPIVVNKDSASKDLPMCLISAIAIGVAGNQIFFDGMKVDQLVASDGILFMCFFAITMYYTYREAQDGATHKQTTHTAKIDADHAEKGLSIGRASLYVALGLVGLVAGGEFIVDGAQGIAKGFGMSERVIGLVIVGPGTSFPELIASIIAARKGNSGMVLGNVLGSNMFNVFFTLGATSMIKSVPLDPALNLVVIANVVVTLLIVIWATLLRKQAIGRPMGAVLVLAYIGYLIMALS